MSFLIKHHKFVHYSFNYILSLFCFTWSAAHDRCLKSIWFWSDISLEKPNGRGWAVRGIDLHLICSLARLNASSVRNCINTWTLEKLGMELVSFLCLFLCISPTHRESACQGLSTEKINSALRTYLVIGRSCGYMALRKRKLVYAENKAV